MLSFAIFASGASVGFVMGAWWATRGERDDVAESHAAHSRCADALAAKNDRIERALECETPNAAHGVKKMARILRGDA